MNTARTNRFSTTKYTPLLTALLFGAALGISSRSHAADAHAPAAHAEPSKAVKKPMPAASTAKAMGEQVREAVATGVDAGKRLTLVVGGKEKKYITLPAPAHAAEPAKPMTAQTGHGNEKAVMTAQAHATPVVNPQTSRQYIKAKAAAMSGHAAAPTAAAGAHGGGEVHWTYEGENGPAAWGQLKPEFNVCAIGKRQSPINIEDNTTLTGPAEPLQFDYRPSDGTVVNNGHTIQVDISGDNSLTVRGSNYRLLQLHFHTPSEERVNYRSYAMVAHLVHKNAEGLLAVVAVLLDPGSANTMIEKVWTYMPLDAGDRVRMPLGLLDVNELLPKDQRYYQFFGSLTTPPCTEGVLWNVIKQPTQVSREQVRLFAQIFPNNARPVQALNGRAVRNAQ